MVNDEELILKVRFFCEIVRLFKRKETSFLTQEGGKAEKYEQIKSNFSTYIFKRDESKSFRRIETDYKMRNFREIIKWDMNFEKI